MKSKKKKSWLKKKVSKSNKITGDQPDAESDWAESSKKPIKKKTTKYGSHLTNRNRNRYPRLMPLTITKYEIRERCR